MCDAYNRVVVRHAGAVASCGLTMAHLPYVFSLETSECRADSISLSPHMTLRNACIDYRDAAGIAWDNPEVPELSGAVSDSQISCMNKFDNNVGAVVSNNIICYDVENVGDIHSLVESIAGLVTSSLNAGTLWSIQHVFKYTRGSNTWRSSQGTISDVSSRVLDDVASLSSPLSLNTVHASMEAAKHPRGARFDELFLFPHNATPGNGLYGTLADNQAVDMCATEEDGDIDRSAREYLDNYIGFICAGHTSHSTEAGRVRRVTSNCRVRVLSHSVIDWFKRLAAITEEGSEQTYPWIVFCMGKYCRATEGQLLSLTKFRRACSIAGDISASLHIDDVNKLVVISVSSGVLFKLSSNGFWVDNVEAYSRSKVWLSMKVVMDTRGSDAVRACQSTFFSTKPYIKSDRAPRPLIASVQLPQAICLPHCPGTAAVSPSYTFKPIVTTPLYNDIMKDQDNGNANLATYLPGENVGVLHLNTEYNYEDSMIVSQKYVDNGGFSSTSICSYLISRGEYVPGPGKPLCTTLSPWWKSACSSSCTHDKEKLGVRRVVDAGSRFTSGTVHSCVVQDSGDQLVRVLSYEQLQRGDKISNGHGQKGIAVIIPPEDMPLVAHPKHGQVVPDVVMAMASVINRQTNGQLYEACKSMSTLENGPIVPSVVKEDEISDVSDECEVFRGHDGKIFKTAYRRTDGSIELKAARATFGYMRMYSQTQKSRERHQVSHLSPGRSALRTPAGRARGGGVACGEMEIQAGTAAGLQSCISEVVDRGDVVTVNVCVTCQRLGLLCTCTTENNHVPANIPYDTVVFDITTYIVYASSIEYVLESQV